MNVDYKVLAAIILFSCLIGFGMFGLGITLLEGRKHEVLISVMAGNMSSGLMAIILTRLNSRRKK